MKIEHYVKITDIDTPHDKKCGSWVKFDHNEDYHQRDNIVRMPITVLMCEKDVNKLTLGQSFVLTLETKK